ncbi:MAG: LuxR C-terminal-related transcriptional regulator [Actinomycetota bacterium]|nr:LuxR C-terminal-related transcriptional regulator [Actinomycetota bacterium]
MQPDPSATLMQSRDSDALRACLRRLAERIKLPVLFGGLAADGEPVLTELIGTKTRALHGLIIRPSSGLGGRVLVERSPRAVKDYRTARSITHDYDQVVLGEGIGSLLSIPVVVFGKTRGLVYLGKRSPARLGERLIDAAVPEVALLETEIRVRDEVELRVASAESLLAMPDQRELVSLREMQAELRAIAAAADDPVIVSRLRAAGDRLLTAPPQMRVLASREVDVLSLVALGCTNIEISTRLCLGVETVRSYLRSAMRKLDTHTRLAAVTEARRRGELL